MFDNLKKQKQQKTSRLSLRMHPHLLSQPPSILLKSCPNIHELNTLKLITCIHLNYIIFTYIEALHKANAVNLGLGQGRNNRGLEGVKIGVIGGGVMGRVFVNGLLVFQREGLDPANITVSTRQEEDLEFYKTLFKVNVIFDNEKLAEESDILIITTPATLDNWIVVDLREILETRLIKSTQALLKNPQSPPSLNPLLYITTSNMTKQKLNKLFNMPFLTPIVRGHQNKYLQELIKECGINWGKEEERDGTVERIQRYLAARIVEGVDELKEAFSFVFERYFYSAEKQRKYSTVNSSEKNSKSGKTINMDIKIIQDKEKQKEKDKEKMVKSEKVSEQASKKSSMSYSANVSSQNAEAVRALIEEVLTVNESMEQTFLTRCRKWRMAYNNFIA